jgi:hypothetical protein
LRERSAVGSADDERQNHDRRKDEGRSEAECRRGTADDGG